MDKKVLVLNQNYEPMSICPVRKAINLIYLGKAELIAAKEGQYIRSVSYSIPFPTAIGYRMNQDDIIRKHVIMRLMCDMELTKSEVEKKFNINFDEYFADSIPKLQEFIEDGLVELTDDKIIVTLMGRLVIRNIAMCFDAYIEKMMREKPIFSRTV